MKQVSVILSTYTADVSGVCSALYELGGMVVIHDPSGCNSTYNTHDEPRWYDQDSLVFISGLSEIDAIMGNDEKFMDDIVRAAKELSPRFIALVRTPVPMMIGTDFEAIRDIIARETGLPVFYFATNGMHSYVQGAGMAMKTIAEKMVAEPPEKMPAGKIAAPPASMKINLLGVTPLDFSVNSTLSSMQAFFEHRGCRIISTFAMGSSPEAVSRAGEADVNVVVSSVGFPAAKVLYERFGTPYVAGMPVEPFADELLSSMKASRRDGRCRVAYRASRDEADAAGGDPESVAAAGTSAVRQPAEIKSPEEAAVYLIGEAVITQSLARAVSESSGCKTRVICPLETEEELMNPESCLRLESEEEIAVALRRAAGIIADPMYRPICPEGVPFYPLPHEAFSGRIYRKEIPDLCSVRFLTGWMEENGLTEGRFSRTEMLLGSEAMDKLKKARVAVFGVGGVGGYVVEALARSGVGAFVLIDKDRVSRSNLNRQIIATEDTIGRLKVDVMRERIRSINPDAEVEVHPCFYLPEKAEDFDFASYSYVVDAIDTVTAKIDIAVQARKAGVPVISCMGAGNKLDPTRFEVADIYKTSVCPLARVMRRELKKRNVKKLKVVYSREEAIKTGSRMPGSVAFVPSAAGLVAAGEVIRDLIDGKQDIQEK